MTFATSYDVRTRLNRPFTDAEAAVVAARLADAESLIKAKIPDLDTASEAVVAIAAMVEASAVARLFKPGGTLRILPIEWDRLDTAAVRPLTWQERGNKRVPFDSGG